MSLNFPRTREKKTPQQQSRAKRVKPALILMRSWVLTYGVIMKRPMKREMITIAIPMDNIWPTSRIVPRVPEATP